MTTTKKYFLEYCPLNGLLRYRKVAGKKFYHPTKGWCPLPKNAKIKVIEE